MTMKDPKKPHPQRGLKQVGGEVYELQGFADPKKPHPQRGLKLGLPCEVVLGSL